jgi:hypothetical protein
VDNDMRRQVWEIGEWKLRIEMDGGET